MARVDDEFAGAFKMTPREDVQNARRIFEQGGWPAIQEALRNGTALPAAVGELGIGAASTSEWEEQ